MELIKTGISIPKDLMEKFDEVVRALGYDSRSKALRDAIQLFITTHSWRTGKGNVVGVFTIIYNHEVSGTEDELSDIQHKFLDIIISTLHIHLTENLCMQVIGLKGSVERAKQLYQEIAKVRGVINIQPVLFTI